MWKYTTRRLLIAVPVLFVISAVDFAFISLAPGDPLQAMLARGGEGGTTAGTAALQRLYVQAGLRGSLPVRYARWLGALARGNFGTSFSSGQPVTTAIAHAVPNTLLLTATAMCMAVLVGLPLGILSALRERSVLDEIVTLASFIFTGIPSFFLALIAVSATVLALVQAPVYVRYMRTAVLDVLREDYTRTARAKGLHETTVIIRHTLPNALLPVLTVVGLSLPGLIGSSVLVEQVFAWPGIGTLSIQSALYRDYPVFMGTALLYAAAVLLSSLITDLAYALIDPRIRYA